MGSIIRNGNDSAKETIDGQQRLTFMTFLLMHISNMLHTQNNYELDSVLPNILLPP